MTISLCSMNKEPPLSGLSPSRWSGDGVLGCSTCHLRSRNLETGNPRTNMIRPQFDCTVCNGSPSLTTNQRFPVSLISLLGFDAIYLLIPLCYLPFHDEVSKTGQKSLGHELQLLNTLIPEHPSPKAPVVSVRRSPVSLCLPFASRGRSPRVTIEAQKKSTSEGGSSWGSLHPPTFGNTLHDL